VTDRDEIGVIVPIEDGSVMGRVAFPFSGLYAATKFVLEGLTDAYRLEVLGHGIDVAIVEPGLYPTGISANGVLTADSSRFSEYPGARGARRIVRRKSSGGRGHNWASGRLACWYATPAHRGGGRRRAAGC
jgi:short-subunit dehydrogenase